MANNNNNSRRNRTNDGPSWREINQARALLLERLAKTGVAAEDRRDLERIVKDLVVAISGERRPESIGQELNVLLETFIDIAESLAYQRRQDEAGDSASEGDRADYDAQLKLATETYNRNLALLQNQNADLLADMQLLRLEVGGVRAGGQAVAQEVLRLQTENAKLKRQLEKAREIGADVRRKAKAGQALADEIHAQQEEDERRARAKRNKK